jgi:hypothetical protein
MRFSRFGRLCKVPLLLLPIGHFFNTAVCDWCVVMVCGSGLGYGEFFCQHRRIACCIVEHQSKNG